MTQALPHGLTGHAEIDEQHLTLLALTARLSTVCSHYQESGDAPLCKHCPKQVAGACNKRLVGLLGELISFMVDHFTYEEILMKRLDQSPASRAHQLAHKQTHAEISEHLSQLAVEISDSNPRESSLKLEKIIGEWIGNHSAGMDNELVAQLADDADCELRYDVELAELLAEAG